PVATGRPADVDRLLAPQQARQRGLALLVGPPRDDRDQVQLRVGPQRRGEESGDAGRPEVLVLDVDQPVGAAEHLPVGGRDAALAEGQGEVADGRSAYLDLYVVPGRALAVDLGKVHRLRVAGVVGVVTAAAGQVDAAQKRNVAFRLARLLGDDQLLVVRATAT